MAFIFADAAKNTEAHELNTGRDAIKQHRILDNTIQGLIGTLETGEPDHQTMLNELLVARDALAALDSIIRCSANPLLYPEHCPPKAKHLAQQVFNIPELLELILSSLPPSELLSAQRTNRQFRDSVDGSTKLQRRLSLVTHSSLYFFAPFAAFKHPGFGCSHPLQRQNNDVDSDSEGNPATAQYEALTFYAKFQHALPRIGSKCRQMLITQPPVKQVKAKPECCMHPGPQRVVEEFISNDKGVTIGDLLAVAARLKREHKDCPYAPSYCHDTATGAVKVVTLFQAHVPLLEDDPLVVEQRLGDRRRLEGKREKKAEKRARRAVEAMIETFRRDKSHAYFAGEPVPMFAEWRERYVSRANDSEKD